MDVILCKAGGQLFSSDLLGSVEKLCQLTQLQSKKAEWFQNNYKSCQ